MNRKERTELKASIEQESVLLKRVKAYVQYGGIVAMVSIIFLFTFLKKPGTWHTVDLVIAIISTIFFVFSLTSYLNGRKHLLKKLNLLDSHK